MKRNGVRDSRKFEIDELFFYCKRQKNRSKLRSGEWLRSVRDSRDQFEISSPTKQSPTLANRGFL